MPPFPLPNPLLFDGLDRWESLGKALDPFEGGARTGAVFGFGEFFAEEP